MSLLIAMGSSISLATCVLSKSPLSQMPRYSHAVGATMTGVAAVAGFIAYSHFFHKSDLQPISSASIMAESKYIRKPVSHFERAIRFYIPNLISSSLVYGLAMKLGYVATGAFFVPTVLIGSTILTATPIAVINICNYFGIK